MDIDIDRISQLTGMRTLLMVVNHSKQVCGHCYWSDITVNRYLDITFGRISQLTGIWTLFLVGFHS